MKKKATAWALAGLSYADPFGAESLELFLGHVKEVKRFGSAVGLPPDLPTELPVC